MPPQDDETRRLQELHDDYAWRVNAAIGEGREDLVWRLVDEYVDDALRTLTDGHEGGCGNPACPVCTRPRPEPHRPQPRGGWLRRFFLGV